MPIDVAADLALTLADCGSPVVFGAQSTNGILRRASDVTPYTDGVDLSDDHLTLTIRDGSLSNLVEDAAITVDGEAYLIRQIGHRLSDGTRRLLLVEA